MCFGSITGWVCEQQGLLASLSIVRYCKSPSFIGDTGGKAS